jgi:ParB family chromosome partitioning protein
MDLPRKGLGRGIASLIPVKREEEVAEERRPFLTIPLAEIVPNPQQPRKFFDEQKIRELAASIREKGILLPLIVTRRNGKYELVSGERRFRAAAVAGLKEVPAVVREAEAAEVLELAIIENVQREDLDPIEEAQAYQDLMDRFGHTQEQVAQKVGKDRATVGNMIRLLKLPLKVKQALQSGKITTGHARALLAVPEIERQLYFVDRIVEEGWSVRELEVRIASKRLIGVKRRRGGQLPVLSPVLTRLIDDLRRRLGTQVRIVPSGKRGKIIIEYYSEVDLDRIYQTLAK